MSEETPVEAPKRELVPCSHAPLHIATVDGRMGLGRDASDQPVWEFCARGGLPREPE